MASQEVTSRVKVGKTIKHQMGSNTELLAIDGDPTKLLVLCGEKFDSAQAFRSGDFSVNMVRVNGAKSISMLTCTIGDHQWLLAKDSLVAYMGERRFVFGFPGFFYGMELGSGAHNQKYQTLEDIFERFCAYKDLTEIEGSKGPDDSPIPENNPWIAAYNKIQKLTTWRVTIFGAPKVAPESNISNLTLYNKIERAVRTSAVVKLLSHTLMTGALNPSKHIQLGATSTLSVAFPTMWVISDLLNALETSRTTANRVVPGFYDGTTWWHVNVEGIMFLLRVMRAFGAKAAVTDKKRKREDEGSDDKQEDKGASGSKLELIGGSRVKRPPCGSMPQVAGLRIGTCGN